MTDDFFDSSDSVRHAKPLEHLQSVTFDEPLELDLGGALPNVTVAYETYGNLNADRSNAVLICHAISGDSHVARHDEADVPGWWDVVVGPGKPIDTDRYFVICPNVLGGCRGTTGPNSINPDTGRAYGASFPRITVYDMVRVQHRLIDHLGIDVLLAVLGGSMGGHQALTWATMFPSRLWGVGLIATSARLTAQALAFDIVARNAILRDPNYAAVNEAGPSDDDTAPPQSGPQVGLAIARMIGHITYLSRQRMDEKFNRDRLQPRDVHNEFENVFSVGSYLGYQGTRFVERFDAHSYITLTLAMDMFDLGDTKEKLMAVLEQPCCYWLVLSFSSDWLFTPDQARDMVDALLALNKPVRYCNIESPCGHDAFLLDDDVDSFGEMIRAFLADLSGSAVPDADLDEDPYGPSPTSIFTTPRLDYDRIMDLIPPTASVLDLGCGRGSLLQRLKRRGNFLLVGIELDESAVLTCVKRGLSVIQADLNKGLRSFADRQFDCVVLSQALQAVKDVEPVVDDMLRVGRRCIVSFPNIAYRPFRERLAGQGRAPKVDSPWGFEWYNTPNIRFLSIADFEDFCAAKGIQVHRRIALNTEQGREIKHGANAEADTAIFVISR